MNNEDLISRLRGRRAFGFDGHTWVMMADPDPDCLEAASAIAAQAKVISGMRMVLAVISEGDHWPAASYARTALEIAEGREKE